MHVVSRKVLHLSRTLHIYLTMLGVFAMLLFGITGFTIDHEDWFNATTAQVTETTGQTPAAMVAQKDGLQMVENLRTTYHISGAMTAFEELDDKFSVGFKDPGQIWEIEIDKPSGQTRVHLETYNFVALINNLHRGRYAGGSWRWVIDLAAILIVLACVTGFVLWLALPKRRQFGIMVLALGTLGTLLVFWALVPGSDVKIEAPAATAAVAK